MTRAPRTKPESLTVGTTINRWTVIAPHYRQGDGQSRIPCRCVCGTERDILLRSLRDSKSCGCYQKEVAAKNGYRHGFSSDRKALWRYTTYNVTPDQYAQMLAEQNNACALCKKEFVDDFDTCIDHCHDSDKVRGLLCRACNLGLGYFLDNPTTLRTAADYVEHSRRSSRPESDGG